jgi:hypothetical protein
MGHRAERCPFVSLIQKTAIADESFLRFWFSDHVRSRAITAITAIHRLRASAVGFGFSDDVRFR